MAQKYTEGQKIEILTGIIAPNKKRSMKPGIYEIVNFRKSFMTNSMVYEIRSTRKNSTYIYTPFQSFLENETNAKLYDK